MNNSTFEFAEGTFNETLFSPLILSAQHWFGGGAGTEELQDLLACPATRLSPAERQFDSYAMAMAEGRFCTCIMSDA